MEFSRIIEKQKEVIDAVRERNYGTAHEVESWQELENLTFAFHSELMELANEVAFFKHWKQGHEIKRERVLEELVDCFAFLFHISIMKNYVPMVMQAKAEEFYVENLDLMSLFTAIRKSDLSTSSEVSVVLNLLLVISAKLGFSEETLENAYISKSDKNIKRQKEGY